jgi:hypothetical protein
MRVIRRLKKTKKTGTFFPDGILQASCVSQYLSSLTVGPCSRTSASNTSHKSQKTGASILPADGVTLNVFFLGQPGCFHSLVLIAY